MVLQKCRRSIGAIVLVLGLLTGGVSLPAGVVKADVKPVVTIYFHPQWGCCKGWGSHLTKNGFKTKMVPMNNPTDIKKLYNIPRRLYSCHTGFIDGYYLEGHIPAVDIHRLLRDKPDIKGLAVPGMPIGSPGMEGEPREAYDVYGIDKSGKISVFSSHRWVDKATHR